MSGLRLPRTLFGGRMRTSTALIAVAFVAVLLVWYAVRPDPATVTEEVVRVTRTVEMQKPAKEQRPPAEEVRPRATPTPTPTSTRTPRPVSTAPSSTKSPSAPATLLGPPASEEPAPSETSPARGGGLFDFQRRTEPPAPSADSLTPAEPRG